MSKHRTIRRPTEEIALARVSREERRLDAEAQKFFQGVLQNREKHTLEEVERALAFFERRDSGNQGSG